MDGGLFLGCNLNGHDLLRGFHFGGHAKRNLFVSLKECFLLGGLVRDLQILQKQLRHQRKAKMDPHERREHCRIPGVTHRQEPMAARSAEAELLRNLRPKRNLPRMR